MIVYADFKAKWVKDISIKEIMNDDFSRILSFYLFHSPVRGLSAMSKELNDYGWHVAWGKEYKLNVQLKKLTNNEKLIFSVNAYSKMDDALTKADLLDKFPSNLSKERIAIYNIKKNQFISIFFHIRNSLAHGRFSIVNKNREYIFVFEDVVKNNTDLSKQKVSARMILKKNTLLKWMELIERGAKPFCD